MRYRRVAVLAALAFSSAPGAAQQPSFCERMAAQLGMTPVERGRQGQTTGEWRVNTLTGIGPALFGGSSTMSVSIRPIGEHSYDEAANLTEQTCSSTRKGLLCRIDQPLRVRIGTRKGEATVESLPGERAEVEIRSVTIFCRDPRAIGA